MEAAYSKHRRQDILVVLRPDTSRALQGFLRTKTPDTKAFNMPSADNVVKMLRVDLKNAGIPYRDEANRVVDFHALRHTTGSLLVVCGIHPKVAQTIMRHSKIELTLSRYSHVYAGQKSQAVCKLPDFNTSSQQPRTGTYDS